MAPQMYSRKLLPIVLLATLVLLLEPTAARLSGAARRSHEAVGTPLASLQMRTTHTSTDTKTAFVLVEPFKGVGHDTILPREDSLINDNAHPIGMDAGAGAANRCGLYSPSVLCPINLPPKTEDDTTVVTNISSEFNPASDNVCWDNFTTNGSSPLKPAVAKCILHHKIFKDRYTIWGANWPLKKLQCPGSPGNAGGLKEKLTQCAWFSEWTTFSRVNGTYPEPDAWTAEGELDGEEYDWKVKFKTGWLQNVECIARSIHEVSEAIGGCSNGG